MRIQFQLELFKDSADFIRSRKALLHLMEALTQINARYLRENKSKLPTLYGSGVLYRREPGTEIWKDVPNILSDGHGDCEDLACWRIAELRGIGIAAQPYVKWKRKRHHALVIHPNGKVEDPSLALGMNGKTPTHKPVYVER